MHFYRLNYLFFQCYRQFGILSTGYSLIQSQSATLVLSTCLPDDSCKPQPLVCPNISSFTLSPFLFICSRWDFFSPNNFGNDNFSHFIFFHSSKSHQAYKVPWATLRLSRQILCSVSDVTIFAHGNKLINDSHGEKFILNRLTLSQLLPSQKTWQLSHVLFLGWVRWTDIFTYRLKYFLYYHICYLCTNVYISSPMPFVYKLS